MLEIATGHFGVSLTKGPPSSLPCITGQEPLHILAALTSSLNTAPPILYTFESSLRVLYKMILVLDTILPVMNPDDGNVS